MKGLIVPFALMCVLLSVSIADADRRVVAAKEVAKSYAPPGARLKLLYNTKPIPKHHGYTVFGFRARGNKKMTQAIAVQQRSDGTEFRGIFDIVNVTPKASTTRDSKVVTNMTAGKNLFLRIRDPKNGSSVIDSEILDGKYDSKARRSDALVETWGQAVRIKAVRRGEVKGEVLIDPGN